jgi:hypothetical protein
MAETEVIAELGVNIDVAAMDRFIAAIDTLVVAVESMSSTIGSIDASLGKFTNVVKQQTKATDGDTESKERQVGTTKKVVSATMTALNAVRHMVTVLGESSEAVDNVIVSLQKEIDAHEKLETAIKKTSSEEKKSINIKKQSTKATDSFSKSVQKMATYAAIAGTAVAALAYADHLFSVVNALDEVSAQTDISADELQRWNFIGEQNAIESTSMQQALGELSIKLGDAALKGGVAADAFRRLGVEIKENGKTRAITDVALETFVALGQIESSAERMLTANDLLGGEAKKMAGFFSLSKDAIEAQSEAFDELGGAISGKSLDDMRAMQQGIIKTRHVIEMLSFELFGLIKGPLGVMIDMVSSTVKFLKKMVEGVNTTRLGWMAFGAVAVAAIIGIYTLLTPLIATIALTAAAIAAAVAAVILVIDDLIAAYQGGASVAAEFWSTFGLGDLSKDLEQAVILVERVWNIMSSLVALGLKGATLGVIDLDTESFDELSARQVDRSKSRNQERRLAAQEGRDPNFSEIGLPSRLEMQRRNQFKKEVMPANSLLADAMKRSRSKDDSISSVGSKDIMRFTEQLKLANAKQAELKLAVDVDSGAVKANTKQLKRSRFSIDKFAVAMDKATANMTVDSRQGGNTATVNMHIKTNNPIDMAKQAVAPLKGLLGR